MSKEIDIFINIKQHNSEYLLNVLRDNTLLKDNTFDRDETFDDYEVEIINDNMKNIRLASSISVEKEVSSGLIFVILYGLFTDKSGYCHKIKLNRTVQVV